MHKPIKDRLEGYLSGMEEPDSVREIERHLESCAQCRTAVDQMRRQSELLQSLRPPNEIEPSAGFYARVLDRIEAQQTPSMWNVFLEPAFGRRLAYISLTLLLILGTLMVTGETQSETIYAEEYPYSPEVIMSKDPVSPVVSDDVERDRNVVLVNLATYEY